MRKLMGVELTKMRYYRVVWGVAVFALGVSGAMGLNKKYDEVIAYYPFMEYIVFFYATCRYFSILTILVTAYVINEDYSMRTVQNVLSVGVDKVKYYLSRLFSQMLFVTCLYLLSFMVYVAVRILSQGRVVTAMSFGALAGVFLMMTLQLMAYVAVASTVSVFCRNQAVAMITGEIWLFLAILFYAYKESGAGFWGFMDFEPLMVMQKVDVWGTPGVVYTLGYFKYMVSAVILTAAAAAVGYLRFVRSDLR